MAGLETASRDLELYMANNWVATAMDMLNAEEGSTLHTPLSQGNADYLSVQVFHGTSYAAEVGAGNGGTKRSEGVLHLVIHVRKGTGSRKVSQYLDTLKDLLEYRKIGTVNIKSFLVAPGFAKDKWFITPVMYNFYFDR